MPNVYLTYYTVHVYVIISLLLTRYVSVDVGSLLKVKTDQMY